MGGAQRDRLGEVDRRAAADGDETIAALRLVDRDRRLDGFLRGVRRHLVEQDPVAQSRSRHMQPLDEPERHHAGIPDDHRPLDPEVDEILPDAGERAVIEADRREVADQSHGSACPRFAP